MEMLGDVHVGSQTPWLLAHRRGCDVCAGGEEAEADSVGPARKSEGTGKRRRQGPSPWRWRRWSLQGLEEALTGPGERGAVHSGSAWELRGGCGGQPVRTGEQLLGLEVVQAEVRLGQCRTGHGCRLLLRKRHQWE